MKKSKLVSITAAALAMCAAQPANAQSISGEVSARGVGAKRDILQNDEFDSSGFGAEGSIRVSSKVVGFRLWADGSAGIFNYIDPDREARQTLQGEIGIARELNDSFEIALRGVYSKDLVFVESLSADQQRARLQVKWEEGGNRFRAYGEYRQRQYGQLLPSDGTGTRFGAEYNRRLGSYHWVRFGGFTDNIDATDDERDYTRASASAEYSRPLSRMFRARAGADIRSWNFPGRIARGDASGDTRTDTAITPQVGLDYGRSGGIFGTARAGYELRTSNDERFDGNTPRFSIELGYRF